MELTTSLESERHANRDIGEKLSETSVELTETKELVCLLLLSLFIVHCLLQSVPFVTLPAVNK